MPLQTQFSIVFFPPTDSLPYGFLSGSAQGMSEECVMKEGSYF